MGFLRSLNFWIIAIISIIVILISFMAGRLTANTGNITPRSDSNDLYATQTATIRGTIQNINGDILTVKNHAGKTGNVEVLDEFAVTSLGTNQSTSAASLRESGLKSGDDVELNLEYINGEYRVVLITKMNPIPKLPNLPALP